LSGQYLAETANVGPNAVLDLGGRSAAASVTIVGSEHEMGRRLRVRRVPNRPKGEAITGNRRHTPFQSAPTGSGAPVDAKRRRTIVEPEV
jgi:hypothetical protein